MTKKKAAEAKRTSLYMPGDLPGRLRRICRVINARQAQASGGYAHVSENALIVGMIRRQVMAEEARLNLPAYVAKVEKGGTGD